MCLSRIATTALLATLGWAALAACDDDAIAVEILDYAPEIDDYEFRVVEIETLENVSRLDGRATTLIGAATVDLDYRDSTLTWDDPGHWVAFAAVRVDDRLVPEDFDSLAMASIYYHLERSLLFFEGAGLDSGRLVHMNTYYWPDFTIIEIDGEEQVMEDNAFYLYASASQRDFYVFPYAEFGWIPLSMNGGVMTHEYTHAVYDALVAQPNRALLDGGYVSAAARNFLYGLNEGVADAAAVARLGDPDFMAPSIAHEVWGSSCNGGPVTDLVRDASDEIHYTDAMDDAARLRPVDQFCPYDIGAFFSSVCYEAQRRADGLGANGEGAPAAERRTAFIAALLRALDDLGAALPMEFELWDIFALLVAEMPDDASREAFCDVLFERYAMHYDEVTGC